MPESKAKPEAISESASSFEAVVIGGGQAGLAMGYFLKRQGRNFAILEAADSIGSAWHTRWESLTLFTPAASTAFLASRFLAIRRAIRTATK
jgi:putative flavoprotein involved in K+ transport